MHINDYNPDTTNLFCRSIFKYEDFWFFDPYRRNVHYEKAKKKKNEGTYTGRTANYLHLVPNIHFEHILFMNPNSSDYSLPSKTAIEMGELILIHPAAPGPIYQQWRSPTRWSYREDWELCLRIRSDFNLLGLTYSDVQIIPLKNSLELRNTSGFPVCSRPHWKPRVVRLEIIVDVEGEGKPIMNCSCVRPLSSTVILSNYV